MILRFANFALLILILSFSFAAFSAEVVQQLSKGSVNWSKGTVSAIGYGVATGKMPEAKKRLMARRAAQLDAYRNLAELVNGVKLTSDTFVRDMVVDNDKVRTSVDALIKGAAITSDIYENGMAIITVTMSLDGRFLQSVTPEINIEEQAAPLGSLFFQKAFSSIQTIEVAQILSAISPISSAHAFAQASDIPIKNNDQLSVAKRVLEMLNDQPKEKVLEQLQQTVSLFEDTTNFTGVLIDARDVSEFELATIPKIRDPNGKVIYPAIETLKTGAISQRPVSYDLHIDDAVKNQRIAVRPFFIKAQGVYRSRRSDLVIDAQSAALLESHIALSSALDKGAVMIVVGL